MGFNRNAMRLAVALSMAGAASWALAGGPTVVVNNGPVQMKQSPITDKDIAAARPLMPTAKGFSPTMSDLNAAMAMRAEQQSGQVDVAGAKQDRVGDVLIQAIGGEVRADRDAG